MAQQHKQSFAASSQVVKWIMILFFVGIFTALCFLVLAPWQLHKNTQTQRNNHHIQQAWKQPPVPLNTLASTVPNADNEYRQVQIDGEFLEVSPIYVRLRSVHTDPISKVLTAFHTTDNRYLLICRGHIPADQSTVPPLPHGKVTITARMRVQETIPVAHKNVISTDQGLQVYSINPQLVTQEWKLPLQPGYFSLTAHSVGVLEADPPPQLPEGPYLSYGLQWILFGILAPLGLGYLIYVERKNNALRAARKNQHHDNAEKIGEPRVPGTSASATDLKSNKKRAKQHMLEQLRGQPHEHDASRVHNEELPQFTSGSDPKSSHSLADRYGKKKR